MEAEGVKNNGGPYSVGFLGGGMMAEALIRGMIHNDKLIVNQSWVSDINPARLSIFSELGMNVTHDTSDVISNTKIVIIAVKPDIVPVVLKAAENILTPDHVLISICAGVSLETLEVSTPSNTKVIRVMPNTPCLVSETAAAYSLGSSCGSNEDAIVSEIFSAVGLARCVPEKLLDAVTGLSGSGPAYVFMFIEALADGGVLKGLPRDTARALAAQLVYGSAKMVLENPDLHVAELRNRVESPGGTTIAGTQALENGNFRATVIGAVSAAAEKSIELGKAGKE
eukprot:CAMPEP_0182441756 /NCGR_PEP_ID=MMETSP1172-20130603/763_1 /TAXON_ID=708627 /ORGANISM="Timspurckia oligopyrenoides, Strain CCMP3278" /LENGTH=282 /DNA_ID=CAMNT_0024636277 /DNA_START=80 /DNA_END=928 /DNA_ORIENTATION=+